MATVTMKAPAPGGLSNKARELMEQLNTDASKSHVWVRTQMNAPAQRPWFTDTGGATGRSKSARPFRISSRVTLTFSAASRLTT